MQLYDDEHNLFIDTPSYELQLEHSLVSLSKWESKWHTPFLTKGDKTNEQTLDYVRCMTISQNINPEWYNYISRETMDKITEYIDDTMTATTFGKEINTKPSRQIITAELIYYWMISFNIPFECQKWHLNRLLTLIKVCNINNQPAKKVTAKQRAAQNKALNEARLAKYNTTG
jgi:hypothetical protein